MRKIMIENAVFAVAVAIASMVSVSGFSAAKINGDFRYRREWVFREGAAQRNRERIRVRVNGIQPVSGNVDLVLGLASGDDDPTTRNQTLTDDFSLKPLRIDLACFQWHPLPVKGFLVTGGKMQMPFYVPGKQELVWDVDLNPEGLALSWSPSSSRIDGFLNTGYFWVEERKDAPDAMLLGIQAGFRYRFRGKAWSVRSGLGYYDYTQTKGTTPFWDASGSGNTLLNKKYLFDYNELVLSGDLQARIGGIPVALFAEGVRNLAVSTRPGGWLVALEFGKCDRPYALALRYNYRELSADGIVGKFCDSDFHNGGTDGRGHKWILEFQAGARSVLAVAYQVNSLGLR